ncbi:MAG: helix-turn-helix domain-containing protein, partial [Rubricoccaceae bacterium]|nr:helix-turn-helix domain-containing protein [Rubricoccaceae bacterium]
VIAATNKDLIEQIDNHEFREDLYHRLSVILIHVPPLRERRGDVPDIARFVLGEVSRRNALEPKAFEEEALSRLQKLDWRGNVRELRNVVERLLILSEGDKIVAADVDRYVRPGGSGGDPMGALLSQYDEFSDFRDAAEKLFIERKLDEHSWNVSKTAEAIGIQRSHLYNKLSKYGIEREESE